MKLLRHGWKKSSLQSSASRFERKRSNHLVVPISREQGVALVVTLLLLAVITFLAVTFLALSRRERGASNNTVEQTIAREAAESALERAKAEMLSRILGSTNSQSVFLLVSTNYQNGSGFDPGAPSLVYPNANVTNVNFGWRRTDGAPLTPDEAHQNLANLFYSPRPPVYVPTPNGTSDFRYYLDFNRNRIYDTNGLGPVITGDQFNPFYHTNGSTLVTPVVGETRSNYFVGDPEWVGVLARPDEPHGPDNLFLSRYAYIVIPSGQALDVNYIHNYSMLFDRPLSPGAGDGFKRNQGFGPWEINLAAFLVDIDTNIWQPQINPYIYDSINFRPNTGVAFDDALSLLRYRYTLTNRTDNRWLGTFGALYPKMTLNGANSAINTDYTDVYGDGPFFLSPATLTLTNDNDQARSVYPWPGDDNPSHFFTPQELFDPGKTGKDVTGPTFSDRLRVAGSTNASQSRYAFYRMLEQLGTDSAPERPGKININYDNLVRPDPFTGAISATNFYGWDPTTFFTNAADRLLRSYTKVWRDENPQLFLNTYGTNQAFGLDSIPVWINNTFVYTPSIHRLLQVAANITDALTNQTFAGSTTYPFLPSVFRPVFRKAGNDIYITGFVESGDGTNFMTKPRELSNPADVAALLPNDNIYGVPWVIGAKKGLPNFNEFAMQSIFQITRKIQVRKPSFSASRATWRTEVQTVVGITNVIGVEAWNSYRNTYTRPVEIIVANDLSMVLTNSDGLRRVHNEILGGTMTIPALGWKGFGGVGTTDSFKVPLRTNVNFLPDSAYINPSILTTNWNDPNAWDRNRNYVLPQWGLAVTNRIRFIMRDMASGRIVDYVQLDGLNGLRNLSEEIRDPDFATGFDGLWSTNRLGSGLLQGMENQVQVSLGNFGGATADWTAYGINQLASGNSKELEIDKFRVFMGLTPWVHQGLPNTNLIMQAPFTPTRRISQHLTWQANDPLVHYLPGDMAYLPTSDSLKKETLKTAVQAIPNVGRLNNRYQPWGGNPDQTGGNVDPNAPQPYEITLKDPLVTSSDEWMFPTNKFASLGQLGRIHRGTPWQTIYMKSPDVNTNRSSTQINPWQVWSGNGNYFDALRTRPVGDRLLFDVFTTAINDNSTRGLLSVNQSGLAAWSAVFSGVPVLTNMSSSQELNRQFPQRKYGTDFIYPVGTTGTNSPLFRVWEGINRTRARFPNGTFAGLGDILATPELSTNSPFINMQTPMQLQKGIPDALYEWLPQQVMGLLRLGDARFVVYAYGQTLKPAERAILTGGTFAGMPTNYMITAEVAARAVLRVEGSPDVRNVYFDPNNPPATFDATKRYSTDRAQCYPPRIVVESFNLLPPD